MQTAAVKCAFFCCSLERVAQKLGSELYRITKTASGHNEAEEVSGVICIDVQMITSYNKFILSILGF